MDEVEVVKSRSWLVQVWLIDEVPLVLKASKRSLNIISVRSTLCERMVFLVLNQIRVRLREGAQLLQSLLKHTLLLLMQNTLGYSRDKQVSLVPESSCFARNRGSRENCNTSLFHKRLVFLLKNCSLNYFY